MSLLEYPPTCYNVDNTQRGNFMELVAFFIALTFVGFMYAHVQVEKRNFEQIRLELQAIERHIDSKIIGLSKRTSKLEGKEQHFEELIQELENRLKEAETEIQEFLVETPDEDLDHLLQTNSAFERRIARMKDELAKQDNVERTGYTAEVLHPNVHNLDHNSIPLEHGSLPDVEYAD